VVRATNPEKSSFTPRVAPASHTVVLLSAAAA
jgi:hypothetical protein